MRTNSTHNSHGFSLIETIVAFAVIIISLSALMTLTTTFFRLMKTSERRIQASIHAQVIRSVLSTTSVCSCQLTPATNLALASTLVIDTTTASPAPISLPKIYSNCNLNSTDSVYAETGKPLTASDPILIVSSIHLMNQVTTGSANEYFGDIILKLSAGGIDFPTPISTRIKFSIDPTLGTATSRPIKTCISPGSALISCPTGFVAAMWGDKQLCIEPGVRTSATVTAASAICRAIVPTGYYPARLCTWTDWSVGCNSGVIGSSSASEVTYTNVINGGVARFLTVKPSSCVSSSWTATSSSLPYRCCL